MGEDQKGEGARMVEGVLGGLMVEESVAQPAAFLVQRVDGEFSANMPASGLGDVVLYRLLSHTSSFTVFLNEYIPMI